VVNPPYGFDVEVRPMLEWLWQVLAPGGAGGCGVSWLVPE
jgi:23S rRNA A2030 N6-methylase RlmJ